MALTITIEGKGVIANADAETNDTGGDGTGDWGFTGSGGVGNGLTNDTFYFGSSSMSMALSGAGKNGWLWFNEGTGLDFTPGSGSESGQFIYFWVHCPTLGLSETLANVGLGIRIGSSTTQHRTFTIAGNDDSNGWDGRWKLFVIDPTKTGSIADGSGFDISAITHFGIKGETTGTAKGDNFFISQIAVGTGLRITGTSTTGWQEAVAYCTDLPNRAWGMLQEREGIFYQYGSMNIGDAASQSAAVSFTDSGRVIQAGLSEYWISSSWATSVDIDYLGINIEDHASWTTTFTDGIIVGSDNGRSGSSFIGNSNHNYFMDLYGGNHIDSVTALYGTSLKNITGVFNSGDNTGHLFYGMSVAASSQFDPVGAPIIRNCTFAETSDVAAALLWNESIDIEDCDFIANTLGAGIEHPSDVGTPYTYTNINFDGNTNDVLNSSGNQITLTIVGGNGSTSEGSPVVFDNPIVFTLTGLIADSEIRLYKVVDGSELDGTESSGTTFQYNYTYVSDIPIYIVILHLSYKYKRITGITLGNTNASVPVQYETDRAYSNP